MLQCTQGVVQLTGKLNFNTVEALLEDGYRLIYQGAAQVFDLSQVEQADSAGLALLLAWWRYATKHAAVIHFRHLPERLQALMAVTNVDKILSDSLL